MAIGTATGTPMMDPRQSIFFWAFWQLHFFIDDVQFGVALQQYGDRAHPGQFVIPSAVAGHIEARHHGWCRGFRGLGRSWSCGIERRSVSPGGF
jgi:hypothetical protein